LLALILVVQALALAGLPQAWADFATLALLMAFFVLEGVGMAVLGLRLFAAANAKEVSPADVTPGSPGMVMEGYGLSPRELEICLLLSEGLVLKVIAARMGISVHTARNHCQNVYRKVGVTTRFELLHRIRTP
jgi:DNA-binding CsgD family transcriptional regulator